MTRTGGNKVDDGDRESKESAAARYGYASVDSFGAKLRRLRDRGVMVRHGKGWVSRSDLAAALGVAAPVGGAVVMVPVRVDDLRRVLGEIGGMNTDVNPPGAVNGNAPNLSQERDQ